MAESWGDLTKNALKVAGGYHGSYSMTRVIAEHLFQKSELKLPVAMIVPTGVNRFELLSEGSIDLVWVIPAISGTWAVEGTVLYDQPLTNVRAIATFPQDDKLLFAVAPWCTAESIDDIREKRLGVRLAVRGNPGAGFGWWENQVLQAYGTSLEDIQEWGGKVWPVGVTSEWIQTEIDEQAVDMVFGEAATQPIWKTLASQGFRFLALREEVVASLEERGLARGTTRAGLLPGIDRPLLTVDQSNFLLCARGDLNEAIVYEITRIIDQNKDEVERGTMMMIYAYDEALPVPHPAWRSPLTGPIKEQWKVNIPLHAGAQRYYGEQGYL